MDMKLFETLDEKELRNYLQFLLWHYRVVDAFWFIYVSEAYDLKVAEKLNEKVWDRISGYAAKKIIENFKITEKGLKGFVQALKYFPWSILVGFKMEEGENEVSITIPSCPAQVARINRGLGEYVCKDMHKKSFESFAKVVDPRIKIECVFAPPDPHPEDVFCKWRITIK